MKTESMKFGIHFDKLHKNKSLATYNILQMARKLGKAISFKHCHKTLIKLVNFTVNCYLKT